MDARLRLTALIAAFAFSCPHLALAQGTKPAPKTAKPPAKSAPAPKKPVAPAVVTPAAPPPPPPPSDVRFKTTYVNGDQTTESASYFHDDRERYELGDTILIKQRDQQRVVQISVASKTYLVTPESAAPPAAAAAPAASGVVLTTVAIVDMGERKTAFGHEARRVRTVIERQPQPGACDQSRVRIETDAWYIDPPKALAAPAAEPPATGAGCKDEIKTTETGDPKLLGFPISYRTTFTEPDNKDARPAVVAMEITEFEVLKLDAALFEIPPGLSEASTPQQLANAISDANEVKIAEGTDPMVTRGKKPGTLRVGVPEVANRTAQDIDTRAIRTRLITELEEQKVDAIPMAAATQPGLDARAKALDVDYLLIAEIADLKASKPGRLTSLVKNTAKEEARDITEARVSVQLVAPGSKPRLSKTSNGKDGGIGLKTGIGLAKFAGSMYLRFYMGGMLGSQLSALGAAQMMNLGGMGNPALLQLQSSFGAARIGGSGFDRTAGAAMYVMQQTMAGAAMSGGSQGGPSFDAALDDAIQDAGKEVADAIKKAAVVKK